MANDSNKADQTRSVEERLKSLYKLQTLLSQIDRIRTVRGELPLEVRDLEDNVAGLQTRISNYERDIAQLKQKVLSEKAKISDSQEKISK